MQAEHKHLSELYVCYRHGKSMQPPMPERPFRLLAALLLAAAVPVATLA